MKKISKSLKSIASFVLLSAAMGAMAGTVNAGTIVNGKEWLQPVDFLNFSYDDVAVVCSPVSGQCAGTLGTTDISGLTWASVDDVNALVNSFGISPQLGPGPASVNTVGAASGWATAFFAAFTETLVTATGNIMVRGIPRTTNPGDPGAYWRTRMVLQANGNARARTNENRNKSVSLSTLGVWLYRPLTPSEMIGELAVIVMELNLQKGISNALDSKLSAALNALDDTNQNNDGAALNTLYAFCNNVDAQRGKKLSDDEASGLIVAANDIIARLDEFATPCE